MVDDVNDNPPVFSSAKYVGHIKENSKIDSQVVTAARVLVRDPDAGDNGSFDLAIAGNGSQLFNIDKTNGKITFKGPADQLLDRESIAEYNLQIIATDKGILK